MVGHAVKNNILLFFSDKALLLFAIVVIEEIVTELGEGNEPHTGVFNRDFYICVCVGRSVGMSVVSQNA